MGTVVRDKWRIDALLGSGGMATVFAATHRNGRRAALKILHSEFARDTNLKERFLREGYVGNKIPHPGRVECIDNDTTEDGSPFLVMELLEGETLDQIWKRLGRRLPVAAALNVAEQLLDFLAACHGQAIIHRDLKPANVFVTHDRQVKVLDFGIAQLREQGQAEHTRAGTTLGTPSFMSPEQARGLGDQLDGRSDLYSVGAMLYALLSGARLNKGRTHDEALIMAATQPAPSIARVAPDLPGDVIALVDKSLAWDRRNRFADAAEMRGEVLRILERLGVRRAPRPEPVAPTGIAPSDMDVEDLSADVHEVVEEAPVEELVADDHPDIERLRGVMRQLERLLPSVRQYGWSHPETERKLRGAFEEVVTALGAMPQSLFFTVRPYSFAHRGREVWEPSAPLDTIPYALFEAGLRTLHLTPGITEPELRALVTVMLLDPSSDLAPEDDLSTVLWDLSLQHVQAEVADGFAEGGAAQREAFYEESDELERLAEQAAQAARAEAKAMAVSVDRAATDSAISTVGLDPVARLALSTQLVLPTERWTERYIDVLVEALLHTRRAAAATRQPATLVLTPLALSCADLVVAGRASVVLSLHAGVLDVLGRRARSEVELDGMAAELTAAMFGGQNFQLLLRALASPDQARPDADRAALLTGLTGALERLPKTELPHALAALPTVDETLRAPLLAFVARAAVGHERELLAKREEWPIEVTRAVLSILTRLGTPGANAAMVELANTPDVALRIEVLAARPDGRDLLGKELGKLVEHMRADVRAAALRAIAQHDVKDCAGALVRRVEDPSFHELPADERREILRVLHQLSAVRAENLAIEQLGQRAMLKSDNREESRLLFAELLGEHARTPAALEALAAAAKGWWGTSANLKSVATTAAAAVEQRIRRGAP